MKIYKVFANTNCRCGVNHGYARKWSGATRLKCKTSIANIVSAKEVGVSYIATIKTHDSPVSQDKKDYKDINYAKNECMSIVWQLLEAQDTLEGLVLVEDSKN